MPRVLPSSLSSGLASNPIAGSTTSQQKYADPKVTTPPNDTVIQEKGHDVPKTEDGIVLGQTRYAQDDTANLVQRQAIQTEAIKISQIQVQEIAQNTPAAAVSPKQLIAETINRTTVSAVRQADTIRAMQKLQRNCNHKYDKTSRRCIYCTKHKDSHVYDVGSKSVLNK